MLLIFEVLFKKWINVLESFLIVGIGSLSGLSGCIKGVVFNVFVWEIMVLVFVMLILKL